MAQMAIMTKRVRIKSGMFFLIVMVLLFTNDCSMVTSKPEVLGQYRLEAGAGKIELNISPDDTFSEAIYLPSGKVETWSGKWVWSHEGISFDQLWIPPAFAPDYILQADSLASANKQPKYTEPLAWYIRPERHWGTVILSIFPDADINFRMVKRFS